MTVWDDAIFLEESYFYISGPSTHVSFWTITGHELTGFPGVGINLYDGSGSDLDKVDPYHYPDEVGEARSVDAVVTLSLVDYAPEIGVPADTSPSDYQILAIGQSTERPAETWAAVTNDVPTDEGDETEEPTQTEEPKETDKPDESETEQSNENAPGVAEGAKPTGGLAKTGANGTVLLGGLATALTLAGGALLVTRNKKTV